MQFNAVQHNVARHCIAMRSSVDLELYVFCIYSCHDESDIIFHLVNQCDR